MLNNSNRNHPQLHNPNQNLLRLEMLAPIPVQVQSKISLDKLHHRERLTHIELTQRGNQSTPKVLRDSIRRLFALIIFED